MLTFTAQLHAYTKKLASDLERDLSQADVELDRQMSDLADTFDANCHIIHEAGQVFRDHIANDMLEVHNEKILLSEHMEAFEKLHGQKEKKLRGLWEGYVEVQKQIMELALVVLDDSEVLVADLAENEGSKLTEGQKEGKKPDLDEGTVRQRRDEMRSCYAEAIDGLAGFGDSVHRVTTHAQKENKDILTVSGVVVIFTTLLTFRPSNWDKGNGGTRLPAFFRKFMKGVDKGKPTIHARLSRVRTLTITIKTSRQEILSISI